MTEEHVPHGRPETYEEDDLDRARRVDEYMDREYSQIANRNYRRDYTGSVPNIGERR
jgi:hypothetical protein